MAVHFTQSDTVGDYPETTYLSLEKGGGTTLTRIMGVGLDAGGDESYFELLGDETNVAVLYLHTDSSELSGKTIQAGTWSVNLDITNEGGGSIRVDTVEITRYSSDSPVELVGSLVEIGQLLEAGTLQLNVSGSEVSFGTGDIVYVIIGMTNTDSSADGAYLIFDLDVDAPDFLASQSYYPVIITT